MNFMKSNQIVFLYVGALAVIVVCGFFYITVHRGFFDDAFIYLQIARNAIDHGTWQYYPGVVDRPALLASSPLRIFVLTVAAGFSKVIGFGGRTLLDARVTLLISGWVSWLAFYPFWRAKRPHYLAIGALLAILSLCLDTVFEFEGGLLLLWIATIIRVHCDEAPSVRLLGWLLPIGMLIRPDMALPIAALFFVHAASVRSNLRELVKSLLLGSSVILLAWSVIALSLGTYPIPVTYWAKASIPLLVEHEFLIQVLPERLGQTLTLDFALSSFANVIIGSATLALALAALAFCRPKFGAFALLVFLVIACAILARLPASFWWYYQNIICIFIGIGVGVLLSCRESLPLRAAATLLGPGLLLALMVSRMPNRGPEGWSTYTQSRAQGYLSIAALTTGRGTVVLPTIGEVIIKNPEIGMMGYFSKKPYFQWDSAGLAQPLDDPNVRNSPLRLFYPVALRTDAEHDAQEIVNRIGKQIPIVEAWAMDNRDYSGARKRCRYVFPQYALCVNLFKTLKPEAASASVD